MIIPVESMGMGFEPIVVAGPPTTVVWVSAATFEGLMTGTVWPSAVKGCGGVATGGGLLGLFGGMAGATGCPGVDVVVEGPFPSADMGVATTIGAWGLGVVVGARTGCGSCFGIDGWTFGLEAGTGGAGGEEEIRALLGLKTVGDCIGLIAGDAAITGAADVVFTSRFCAGAD